MAVSLLQQRAIDLSSPTFSYRSHLRVGGAWRRVDVVRRGEDVQKSCWAPHAFNLMDVCLREALDFLLVRKANIAQVRIYLIWFEHTAGVVWTYVYCWIQLLGQKQLS